jgi:hypothetical protein
MSVGTWSVSLREAYMVRVFKNRAVGKIVQTKMEVATRD